MKKKLQIKMGTLKGRIASSLVPMTKEQFKKQCQAVMGTEEQPTREYILKQCISKTSKP